MKAPRYFLIAVAIVAITGCVLRPAIIEANVRASDEMEIVEVIIKSSDARIIKDREIYFSMVVVDCEDDERQFPVQPYITGRPASKFDYPIVSEYVSIQGKIPRRVFADYLNLCIFLRGGGYISGGLESRPIRIVKRSGEGAEESSGNR